MSFLTLIDSNILFGTFIEKKTASQSDN